MPDRPDPLPPDIASTSSVRERFDDIVRTTASEHEDHADSGRPDEETSSFALEEYLTNRLQQIGEAVPTRRIETDEIRTGNGWDPSKVPEHVYKIEPVPIKQAVEVALSAKRTLGEKLSNMFRGSTEELRADGKQTVEFIPIWKVKGFHECYYLRANSYKVRVRDDVVAVDVEGKNRDIILEHRHRRLIPATIFERIQRLGSFLSSDAKYFLITDVMELAVKKSQSELVITGMGRELDEEEESTLTSWRTKRIFDVTDLNVRGADVKVREPALSKAAVINKFRERVIIMPERFKQILSNKLQIAEVKRIYVPFVRIRLQKGLVPQEVIVNGTSGEIAKDKMLEILE